MSALASVTDLGVTASDGSVILEHVDLALHPGHVTALVGPSGAGKTTLAQAFLGHLGPGLALVSGGALVAGHDPFSASGRRALRGRIVGYLPQDPASALDPRRTVAAQLRTAARIASPEAGRASRTERVREAASAAAFDEELLDRRPAQLSGGQAQRALLAWAYVARPRILVLDEPTSGLDPGTARRVSDAFTRLPWGPAVLLISHDRELVARAADDTAEIVDGRVHAVLERPTAAAAPHDHQDPPTVATSSGSEVLAASGVTIRRGGTALMDEGSLTLHAGDLVALRGASGSGKTSLALALCGLAPPDRGHLRIHGTPTAWHAGTRARSGQAFLAYAGQDARAALNPHETIRRTLTRARRSAARRDPTVGVDVEELLDRFGLPRSVLDRAPDRLSGGQRHRVALARAVAAAPAVLVCDETTAALDHATAALVLDTLDGLRADTGLPVLFITHQDEVATRADRVLTLAGGRLR
ncbi:ABC transporter ATP-binding protein [Nitriliruptor alkaliphilus]|uniref:ABC transporter ATP-binding protein n=1 Tax=Nitriliruptor alkaliphilus TaxID=427918 RepID=UPI00069666A6|nr:ATP-binding cassette domain-containing protein [Nitriliruptor alkaliphilus]